jgi:trk system potassium uptake protein TrkA
MPRFAIIGLGHFGMTLTQSLAAAGAEVIAIDKNRSLVEEAGDYATLAVRLDSTEAEALREQGVDEVDVGVIGIGDDFESAALTTAALKSLGVPKVVARASSPAQDKILRSIGADEIVEPESESAIRWANQLMMYRVRNLVELGEGHSLAWIKAPKAWHHKTPLELKLRPKLHVNLVAVSRTVQVETGDDALKYESAVITVPDASTTILPNDTLILAGTNDALAALTAE